MKKTAIAILMSALMMISIMTPLLSTVQADTASWYTSVNGVLNSDYYSLYPYNTTASVNVGFSKFGELIGLPAGKDPTTATQADYVGLEYNGSVDPFCPATVVPMTSWINGWYIDLQYIDPALSGVLRDRHVWAFAMFGDGFGFGGDWVYAATPGSNPGHGRQTNGYCVTDPLTVLYNGPREYIAMAVTHIYDKQGTTTWQVVDLAITMRFDKVSKEVVLYKDVKLMLPKLHLWGKLDVQLSNREEYDLGPAPTYASYAHFYKDFAYTPYDANWHMASNLTREYVDYFAGNGVNKVFTVTAGSDIASDFIKIWINGVFQDPSTYTIDWNTGKITFAAPPAADAVIEVHYKYLLRESMWQYDVAQVISSNGAYVAWAAMWPPVSDYTVDGILRYMDPLVQVNENDMDYEPKQSPLVIGEWDFLMDHTTIPQYRCVEVKGITDRHDAQDSNHGDGNVVDREAKYQLDMVFNPWDLNSAVEKKTESWVEWKTTGTSYTTHVRPGVYVPTSMWDQYGVFSERVIAYYSAASGGPRLLNRWLGEYSVTLNAGGYLVFSGLPTVTCKILYSTKAIADAVVLIGDSNAHSAPSGLDIFGAAYGGDPGRDEVMFTADDLDYARVISDLADKGISVLGVNYGNGSALADANFAYIAANTGGAVYNGLDNWNTSVTNWVLSAISKGAGVDVVFVVDASGSMSMNLADLQTKIGHIVDNLAAYDVTFGLGAFVDYPAAYDSYGYSATYGSSGTGDYAWNMIQDLTANGVLVKSEIAALTTKWGGDNPQDYTRALYESQFFDWRNMGRYEWVEAGRDAQAVDNTGAALVAEAFDSYKIIGIGISGTDMFNDLVTLQCPNIMAKYGAGTEVLANYKDALGRASLADDWCTYWPVASSNIIGVGGPYANLFAYYANDFEDAFYGMSPYAGSIYSGYITGIPCWNRGWRGAPWNVYSSYVSSSVGYAVISTTIDLNGTVLFNVYGHFGRDTYYACQWLHGDEARDILDARLVGSPGIQELQLAPKGLTSIILQINYGSDPKHPTFTIPECLGTISETSWYCYGNPPFDVTNPIKGGIHDP
jgi:hypothetical protein